MILIDFQRGQENTSASDERRGWGNRTAVTIQSAMNVFMPLVHFRLRREGQDFVVPGGFKRQTKGLPAYSYPSNMVNVLQTENDAGYGSMLRRLEKGCLVFPARLRL
jgi:hypothetical protein